MQPATIPVQSSPFIDRACACCGGTRAQAVVTAPKPSEALDLQALLGYWNHLFNEKSFFTYHRCQDCGLLYAPRFLSLSALAEIYGLQGDNTGGQPLALMEATQLGYFRMVEPHIPRSGSFLEIGPDIGLFTGICADRRNFDRYWLFEPNVGVHPQLAERMAGRPHRILTSLEDLSPVPSGSTGLAAMIHVLDHLLDPVNFLKQLRRCMAPGGRLVIVTHNERSLLARLQGPGWAPYCPLHPQLYNPRSIAATLSQAGFRAVTVRRPVNYFPVMYLMRHLAFALGMGKLNLPEWPQLAVGLRLGNILTVAEPV